MADRQIIKVKTNEKKEGQKYNVGERIVTAIGENDPGFKDWKTLESKLLTDYNVVVGRPAEAQIGQGTVSQTALVSAMVSFALENESSFARFINLQKKAAEPASKK